MPFTFAHPAVLLPLLAARKKYLSVTGLVIGSIIPDFESFLMLTIHKIHSHTWLGIFWYDMPLAIIFSFIFHNIIRNALLSNLPVSIAAKFAQCLSFNWNRYFFRNMGIALLSLLIGIISHLLWDAFTHLNLFVPNAVDSAIYIGRLRLFKILQYSNSILGMAAIVRYIYKMPDRSLANTETNERMMFKIGAVKQAGSGRATYWTVAFVIGMIIAAAALLQPQEDPSIVLYIDIGIFAALMSLITTPLVLRLVLHTRY